MNAVSLFSGIGGLDEGLRRAGFRHLLMCESDPWRRDVLAVRFPGVELADDVRDVALSDAGRRSLHRTGGSAECEQSIGRRFGRTKDPVDLLCGGFPCQDLSVAGKRAGLAGDRSGIFFEFARIAEALRPRAVLLENVPGLLSSNGGRDFGVVLGTLADLGYGMAWRIVDSRYFGVPQRRRRVFILGVVPGGRAGAERAGEILAVGTRCDRHPATGTQEGTDASGASVSGTLGGRRGFSGDDIDRGGGIRR